MQCKIAEAPTGPFHFSGFNHRAVDCRRPKATPDINVNFHINGCFFHRKTLPQAEKFLMRRAKKLVTTNMRLFCLGLFVFRLRSPEPPFWAKWSSGTNSMRGNRKNADGFYQAGHLPNRRHGRIFWNCGIVFVVDRKIPSYAYNLRVGME